MSLVPMSIGRPGGKIGAGRGEDGNGARRAWGLPHGGSPEAGKEGKRGDMMGRKMEGNKKVFVSKLKDKGVKEKGVLEEFPVYPEEVGDEGLGVGRGKNNGIGNIGWDF